jgi:hypothetical protein
VQVQGCDMSDIGCVQPGTQRTDLQVCDPA